jgi:sec-independent protein translocase protein TatA
MGIGGFGPGEMVFVFLIVLLLFGAKRLPEIGSSLGKGIREFKSSFREIEQELKVPSDHQIHRTTTPPGEEQASSDDHGEALSDDHGEASSDDDGEPRTLSDSVPTGLQQ